MDVGVRDERAAEGAGRVGGPVLGQRAETRLAEDVSAGLTAVRAEVNVQTHGAGQTFSVLLLTVQQCHTLRLHTNNTQQEGKTWTF